MSIEVVRQVKEELYAAGANLDGPCGAHKITANVAWRLQADGWGLIHSSGNGCDANGDRYRADTIMKQDGSVIDILIKSEGVWNEAEQRNMVYPEVPKSAYNIPAWNPTGGQPASNWRAPYFPGDLNPIPIPPGNGGGGEPPQPPVDNSVTVAILEQLKAINEKLNDMQPVLHTVDSEAKRREYSSPMFSRVFGTLKPSVPAGRSRGLMEHMPELTEAQGELIREVVLELVTTLLNK